MSFSKKTLLVNLFFVGFGAGMFIAGFELFLTLRAPKAIEGGHSFFQQDSQVGLVLRPGLQGRITTDEYDVSVRVNSLGMRDAEPDSRYLDAFRILGLGDSHTFGTGVEVHETYLGQLEAAYAEREHEVRIFKAGVSGFGTDNELLLFEKLEPDWKFDAVILGFTLSNDALDTVSHDLFFLEDGTLKARPIPETFSVKRVERREALLSRFIPHSTAFLKKTLKESPTAVKWGNRLGLNLRPVEIRQYFRYDDGSQSPEAKKLNHAWTLTEAVLSELHRQTQALDIPLLVVAIPSIYQVEEAKYRDVFALFGEDFDLTLTNQRLAAICQRQGILLLDPLKDFQTRSEAGEVLYFPVDHHMNVHGHARLAELVDGFLTEHFTGGGHPRCRQEYLDNIVDTMSPPALITAP